MLLEVIEMQQTANTKTVMAIGSPIATLQAAAPEGCHAL